MITINNFNLLPASFVEVSPHNETDLYTRGKLKVFYVGETADHRLFTKQFSDRLLKTIGYTPVVSRYNKEKDDFEGHAAEQDIYGIVDPMVEPTYEKDENGIEWAICDVIIYDKRPDSTGEIASKIIGHPQSLELKSDTLQYKINRDIQGNFKNLEFLDGQFIGVSVLGHDQEPAFTGSAFFEELDSTANRGKEMTLEIPEFMKLSWGEKANLLYDALLAKYGENFWMLVDMYDNAVVYRVWCPEEEKCRMYRMKYGFNGDAVEFNSEPEEVHPSYEKVKKPDEEPEETPIAEEGEPNANDQEDLGCKEPKPEECDNQEPAVETNADDAIQMTVSEEPVVDNATIETIELTVDNCETTLTSEPVNAEKGEDVSKEEKTVSTSAALSDAERIELEAYRKEKKVNLIGSYNDMVPTDALKPLLDEVDSYTYEDLENKLNSLYVLHSRSQVKAAPANMSKGLKWVREPSIKHEKNMDVAEYIRNMKR